MTTPESRRVPAIRPAMGEFGFRPLLILAAGAEAESALVRYAS